MKITHTSKEIVSSIDISLYDIPETQRLLYELKSINRKIPIADYTEYGISWVGSAYPHIASLISCLESKIKELTKKE